MLDGRGKEGIAIMLPHSCPLRRIIGSCVQPTEQRDFCGVTKKDCGKNKVGEN